MKKNYESPKAEKLEFNYDVVMDVSNTTTDPVQSNSGMTRERYYTSPQAGSPPPCSFQWRYISNC